MNAQSDQLNPLQHRLVSQRNRVQPAKTHTITNNQDNEKPSIGQTEQYSPLAAGVRDERDIYDHSQRRDAPTCEGNGCMSVKRMLSSNC